MVRHPVTHTLQLVTLGLDSGVMGPQNELWQVKLSDPATFVMTDFRENAFFKVGAEEHIEEALRKMKHAGLRAAFVLDKNSDKLLGMITSYDIMGEKPLRYMQSAGIKHKDIQVRDIMEGLGGIPAVDMHDVEKATVQLVLEALQKSGRTHLPVVESKEGETPRLRGIFSSSKVLRLTEDSRENTKQA